MHTINAQDAGRRFPALLCLVAQGAEVVLTSHGKPVARLVHVADGAALRQVARRALLAHLSERAEAGSRDGVRDGRHD